LLPVAGGLHTLLALWLLITPTTIAADAWFGFDPLARAVLPMVSLLFLVCSIYGVTYLHIRAERKNRIFVTALLVMLGLLSLALQAQNLGLLWVAAEATTLVTVPLLHFNGTARAFEASWKYLLVGGTGIALSLLGSFCLGYASLEGGGNDGLTFSTLVAQGASLSRPWLIIAWVLLLAGGTTTMAFVAILRVKQVVDAAGGGAMTERTLLAFGLFSMLVAALFLLTTPDFKRMLAYSSVEHMGILAVGAALADVGENSGRGYSRGDGLSAVWCFFQRVENHSRQL
jgi:hydrogenase-4 component F